MAMLRRVILKGFTSIKAMDLELRPLNVLIGANGAGKSNLVSFFKMLNEMMGGRLQMYIGTTGRAQSLLHFGPKVTPQMEARLEFEADNAEDTYAMHLDMIWHGRHICRAQRPRCMQCPLRDLCLYGSTVA